MREGGFVVLPSAPHMNKIHDEPVEHQFHLCHQGFPGSWNSMNLAHLKLTLISGIQDVNLEKRMFSTKNN